MPLDGSVNLPEWCESLIDDQLLACFRRELPSCRHSRTTRRNRKAREHLQQGLFSPPRRWVMTREKTSVFTITQWRMIVTILHVVAPRAQHLLFLADPARASAQSKCRANRAARFHPPVTCRRHCVIALYTFDVCDAWGKSDRKYSTKCYQRRIPRSLLREIVNRACVPLENSRAYN